MIQKNDVKSKMGGPSNKLSGSGNNWRKDNFVENYEKKMRQFGEAQSEGPSIDEGVVKDTACTRRHVRST